jgi:uncharacterized protein involved in type VI secretion and phage assembly
MNAPAGYRARALDKPYFGVCIGLVESNKDPKGQGRVTLKYPWYDNHTVSDWCRVVYLNAGPNHGFIAVPEEKTEVLVAFEHGDMRRPFVLGGLYNGVEAPPAARKKDAEQDEKVFRTHAGHVFALRDTTGKTEIELKTTTGHQVLLRDQRSGESKVLVTSKNGHQVVLDDQGGKVTVTTSTGQSVVLEAGKCTITATQVSVAASKIELGTVATQSVILGDAFIALFNAHVHTNAITSPVTGTPVPPIPGPAVLSQVVKTG